MSMGYQTLIIMKLKDRSLALNCSTYRVLFRTCHIKSGVYRKQMDEQMADQKHFRATSTNKAITRNISDPDGKLFSKIVNFMTS